MYSTIDRMAALSACMMEQPFVWPAVLELAKKLPRVGQVTGSKTVAIITSVLPESALTGMFADIVEGLGELEAQINAAAVAFAETPDGSKSLIKGEALVENAAAGDGRGIEAWIHHCANPVLAETVCRAFRDGAS
jgi:hypothetical protein